MDTPVPAERIDTGLMALFSGVLNKLESLLSKVSSVSFLEDCHVASGSGELYPSSIKSVVVLLKTSLFSVPFASSLTSNASVWLSLTRLFFVSATYFLAFIPLNPAWIIIEASETSGSYKSISMISPLSSLSCSSFNFCASFLALIPLKPACIFVAAFSTSGSSRAMSMNHHDLVFLSISVLPFLISSL